MKLILSCLLLITCMSSFAQGSDEAKIRTILHNQTEAWNRGDLETFMSGYWQNDSLMFIGKSGVTYGYAQTLANYHKGYPDSAHMGKLNFDVLKVKRLSPEYYWVLGKWFLKRSVGDIGGHYTLLFRKIKGKWVIIADHSS
jgi:ketosteroid isomerase-like protein